MPAVSRLYDRLGQVARLGAITSYQELDAEGYAMTTPDLRDRLDDVALLCYSRKQPLLPALVVNRDWQIPDPHFFEVAARCGVYRGTAELEGMRRWWDRYAPRVWLYWRGDK